MLKVGDKVMGFKFDPFENRMSLDKVFYIPAMDKYVGKWGIINSIYHNVSFNILFEDNRKFTYRIAEYLVLQREEKLKELGILDLDEII